MAAFNYRPGGNPILQLIVGAGVLALCVGVFVAMLPVVLVVVATIFVAAVAYFAYLKLTGKLDAARRDAYASTWTYTYSSGCESSEHRGEAVQRLVGAARIDESTVEDIEEVPPKTRKSAKK